MLAGVSHLIFIHQVICTESLTFTACTVWGWGKHICSKVASSTWDATQSRLSAALMLSKLTSNRKLKLIDQDGAVSREVEELSPGQLLHTAVPNYEMLHLKPPLQTGIARQPARYRMYFVGSSQMRYLYLAMGHRLLYSGGAGQVVGFPDPMWSRSQGSTYQYTNCADQTTLSNKCTSGWSAASNSRGCEERSWTVRNIDLVFVYTTYIPFSSEYLWSRINTFVQSSVHFEPPDWVPNLACVCASEGLRLSHLEHRDGQLLC